MTYIWVTLAFRLAVHLILWQILTLGFVCFFQVLTGIWLQAWQISFQRLWWLTNNIFIGFQLVDHCCQYFVPILQVYHFLSYWSFVWFRFFNSYYFIYFHFDGFQNLLDIVDWRVLANLEITFELVYFWNHSLGAIEDVQYLCWG